MRLPREFGFSIAGKRKRSPEFPCVSRFRQRRLISFLVRHEFSRTADMFLGETDVFMSIKHLLDLVQVGSWDEAINYLSHFLPSDRPLGIHGRALFHFLRLHEAIAHILAGAPEARSVTVALEQCIIRHPTKSHTLTRLRAIFSSLLCSKRFRTVLDLGRVRLQASMTIIDLVYKTPELKDHMLPARGPMKPQNVLPIGFVYACFRPRRHVKKRGGRIPAPVVGGLYLQKKMLPSLTSSDHSQGLACESLIKAKEWLVDLVETSLEAGKLSEEDLPQSACNKGAPDTPLWLTNLPTFKMPVNDLTIFCKAKEWAVYLIEERLEAWPDMSDDYDSTCILEMHKLGYRIAWKKETCVLETCAFLVMSTGVRFSQTMLDTFTNPAKDSGAYEHLSQEYCSDSMKNPRVKLATLGQGFDPKRQQTTPTSQIETGTEDPLAAWLPN